MDFALSEIISIFVKDYLSIKCVCVCVHEFVDARACLKVSGRDIKK